MIRTQRVQVCQKVHWGGGHGKGGGGHETSLIGSCYVGNINSRDVLEPIIKPNLRKKGREHCSGEVFIGKQKMWRGNEFQWK